MTRSQIDSRPQVSDGSALLNALLQQRYLLKDENGRVVETYDQMLHRVADAMAPLGENQGECDGAAERRIYYSMMADGEFLPNSPALMNAGRKGGLLSACFVLPVPDSIDGIFTAVRHTALVQKAGGGTGFAFDQLRPTGDLVASSGGMTSGPLAFLKVFCEATAAIQQGAFRRGANMAMMSVEHPDILKFIAAKGKPGAFENFNFSVKVTEEFMKALSAEPSRPHVVTNPRDGRHYLIARGLEIATYAIQNLVPVCSADVDCWTTGEVWDLIVQSAWATGEPGLCFIDRVNAANPTPAVGRIESMNACGEQPLLPHECCCLGSLNLAKFVNNRQRQIDWEGFGAGINHAVGFLDDMIDATCFPTPETAKATRDSRKIGLGVMGFADALILLGIPYGSEDAVALASTVAEFLNDRAHEASEELAEIRGPFPNWQGSIWDTKHHRPMRNATCTTIAPTGSISLLAGCSSGIEPIFSLATTRRALDGREFVSVHSLLEELGRRDGWMNDQVREALLRGKSPTSIAGVPTSLAKVLVTAHEVPPEFHVRIQAAFQEHIDNAVSKTVNLPASATLADVDKIFRMARQLGCKGITVYRDGSRLGQTLSGARTTQGGESAGTGPRPRSRVTVGKTYKFRMGCGTLFVTVNRDETGLCEVFANLGKAGGCPSQSEATCRAVSAALRSGVNPAALIEQLRGIRCTSTCMARREKGDIDVLSCPDAIARAIQETLAASSTPATAGPTGRLCPHCQMPMHREAGCFVCDRCLFNSCG